MSKGFGGIGGGRDELRAEKARKARTLERRLREAVRLARELKALEILPCDDVANLGFYLAGADAALRHYMEERLVYRA